MSDASPSVGRLSTGSGDAGHTAQHIEDSIANVRDALAGLRYGSINLTIHEGRVVQIDVTEKRRLRPS